MGLGLKGWGLRGRVMQHDDGKLHVHSMRAVYPKHIQSMPKAYLKFAYSISEACPEQAHSIPRAGPQHTQSIPTAGYRTTVEQIATCSHVIGNWVHVWAAWLYQAT